MATSVSKKDERIDVRVSTDSKTLFARAAEISGLSMTAFVIEAARERAARLIAEHERLLLKNQARDVFLNALASPPAPSDALRRAAEKYAVK
ncbi:DUF1778 domain-containing protein [Sulfuriflexus mobilis]|uniref:type II toxin-antitoxin system TacA family antitoxin n=1 Tax=Sulfuriflexus mobilis TaxID=1811807 RepID=UPI000F82AC39|nr:DUF1778 domain-containing protein [Sulfuriflexus mobilis]